MVTDQEIRDAGILYLPKQKYLANPFVLPEEEDDGVGDGGGGASTFPTPIGIGDVIMRQPQGQLLRNFQDAVSSRQNRLQNPDPFAQKIYNMGFPKQRSVDQMIRDATGYNMAQLGPDFKQIGITSNMSKPEIDAAMAAYAADETSIGNYPVDDPRDVRTNLPFGLTGILSRLSPSSYFDKMTVPEQIYTQSKLGYTGPTVFGENNTGLSKDIFGRNVISAFGNYAEKQKKDIAKLNNYFDSEAFDKKYGKETTLEFDEETGQFMFKGPGAKAANQMNKLNLLRYNYDKTGLSELDEIKDQTGFTDVREAEAEADKRREKEFASKGMSDPSDVSRTGASGRRPGSGGDGPGTQDSGGPTGGYSYDSGGRQGFGYGLKKGGLAGVLGF
jgi:hypothetical protein